MPISSVVTEAVNGVVDECTGRINAYVAEVAKSSCGNRSSVPSCIGGNRQNDQRSGRCSSLPGDYRKKRLIASMSRQQSFFKKVRQNNSDSWQRGWRPGGGAVMKNEKRMNSAVRREAVAGYLFIMPFIIGFLAFSAIPILISFISFFYRIRCFGKSEIYWTPKLHKNVYG